MAQDGKRFITCLYEIMNNEENAHGIGFSPNGIFLEIRDTEFLCRIVLPRYFRHSNLRSLVRQLNNYGFVSKPTRPSISQCFYHPLFARGKQGVSDQIKRKVAATMPAQEQQQQSKRSNNEEDTSYAAAVHANKLLMQRNLELETRIRILEETVQKQQQQASYVNEPPTPLSQYLAQQHQLPRINSNGFASPMGSHYGSFFAAAQQQPPSPSMAQLSKLVRSSGENSLFSSFYNSNNSNAGGNIRASAEDDDLLSLDIMHSLQCRASMESLNE